jgi:hypothetical protein
MLFSGLFVQQNKSEALLNLLLETVTNIAMCDCLPDLLVCLRRRLYFLHRAVIGSDCYQLWLHFIL